MASSSFRVVSCEVGKLLPLLVCPRCVIDTGHTAWTVAQQSRQGRQQRTDRWTDGCGMQPPRGSICPQGPSCAHLFLAIDFHCAPRFGARDHSQRTHHVAQVSLLPSPLTTRSMPLPTSCLFWLLLSYLLPQLCSAFLCSCSPFLPVFFWTFAAHSNVTLSAQGGEWEEGR